jgi:transposase
LATSRGLFPEEPPAAGPKRSPQLSSSGSMRRRRSGVTSNAERSGISGQAVPSIGSDAMIRVVVGRATRTLAGTRCGAGLLEKVQLAAQHDHVPQRGLEAREQRPAHLRQAREDQVQQVLAVGAAPDRRAVVRGQDIPAEALRRSVRLEADGRIACRLIAIANALAGMSRAEAAHQAGMDRQTLRDWVIRFNDEEVAGLGDRPKRGRPSWLDEGQLAPFKALVLRGPDPERDGVSTWRTKDCRGALRASAMARPACCGCSTISACPGRRRAPCTSRRTARLRCASEKCPVLIAAVGRDHREVERLEVWFRASQTGRACRRWFERGVVPRRHA